MNTHLYGKVGPGQQNHRADVLAVQQALNRPLTCPIKSPQITGIYDLPTQMAVCAFQREFFGMQCPDGVVAPFDPIWQAMAAFAQPFFRDFPWEGSDKHGEATEKMFQETAADLGCEVACIHAVATQESSNTPFLSDDRPKILFEPQKFNKHTRGKFRKTSPDLCKGGPGGSWRDQYTKLYKAYKLAPVEALMSCSWGMFQIMGENYNLCNCNAVSDLVEVMYSSVEDHFVAFEYFVRNQPALHSALKRKDWLSFKNLFNGRGENSYASEITGNYRMWASRLGPANVVPKLPEFE